LTEKLAKQEQLLSNIFGQTKNKEQKIRALLKFTKGKIVRLINLPLNQFCEIAEVKPDIYHCLQSAIKLYQLSLEESLHDGEVYNSPELFKTFFHTHLKARKREYVMVIYLDNRLKMLEYKYIFQGNVNRSVIHMREIVRYALNVNAVNIALAHNHPTGSVKPSQQDLNMTKELIKLLKLVDMELIDHFIVGDSKVLSLKEEGLM